MTQDLVSHSEGRAYGRMTVCAVYLDALISEGRRDYQLQVLYTLNIGAKIRYHTCFLIGPRGGARQVPRLASPHEIPGVDLPMVAMPFLPGSILSLASMAEGCGPCKR